MVDQVSIIIADLDRFTTAEIIALALNMDASLRANPPLGTPVDTGWAAANWLPSIGSPKFIKADTRDPTPAQVAARAQMAARGMNEVLAWTKEQGPIFITNNVPYIGALNRGHSPQSPPGFVQDALVQAVKETSSRGANKAARDRRAAAGKAKKARPK